MNLLTLSSSKIDISNKNKVEWQSCILYLLPHKMSGKQVCPSSSHGCRSTCLNWTGRGRTNLVQNARLRKTNLFFDDRSKFTEMLYDDVVKFEKKCQKLGKKPAIRINGTSDLDIPKLFPELFINHLDIKFYDYTKIFNRYMRFLNNELPSNYHLTFSRHENNHEQSLQALHQDGNVAVVFRDKNIPKKWNGFKVISGDTHDLRFLDRKNSVVGLYAKGKAKYDTTGFVVG